jgi:bifunctional DNA-binding transcriptional regulator/antitoxin component of YhaV-PrlF toxin-antitoxin module
MPNKTELEKTQRGKYFIVIPKNLMRITKWEEGDIIEVIPGSAVSVKKDDLILRKVP